MSKKIQKPEWYAQCEALLKDYPVYNPKSSFMERCKSLFHRHGPKGKRRADQLRKLLDRPLDHRASQYYLLLDIAELYLFCFKDDKNKSLNSQFLKSLGEILKKAFFISTETVNNFVEKRNPTCFSFFNKPKDDSLAFVRALEYYCGIIRKKIQQENTYSYDEYIIPNQTQHFALGQSCS